MFRIASAKLIGRVPQRWNCCSAVWSGSREIPPTSSVVELSAAAPSPFQSLGASRMFASFSMDQLKELRGLSGAPIVDCKKALSDAEGDIDKAMDWLRQHGAAKASSKVQGREAAEGLVSCMVSDDGKTASIVKVSSETDFAGKSSAFVDLCIHVAGATLSTPDEGVVEESSLMTLENESKAVKTALEEAIVAIRENIGLPFAAKWKAGDNGLLVSYVHGKVDGRLAGSAAALVEISGEGGVERSALEEVGKKLAMHIVAAKPEYLSPDDVPIDIVEKEREILQAQIADTKKPAEVVSKIIDGRLRKFFQGVCLTEQEHLVEEGNPMVSKALKKEKITVKRFQLLSI